MSMYPGGATEGAVDPSGLTLQVEQNKDGAPADVRVATVGGQDVPLILSGPSVHDLVVGLSWDFEDGQEPVDLDCSVLCCNSGGAVLDVCFYNQPICMAGAITHSGDNKTGEGAGFDEAIALDIEALPPGVSLLVFVLNAYQGGTLSTVKNAKVTVMETGKPEPLAMSPASIRKADLTGMVLGFLYILPHMGENTWKFRNVSRACQGRNFEESLPDVQRALGISGLLNAACANMVMSMDKKFDMQKGDFLEIPPHLFKDGSDLFVGLGWETRGPGVDLDASVLLVDGQANLIDVVNWSNLSFMQGAIKHGGDNLTGHGKGDDERIDIDLDRLPPVVQQLFVVVNVYNSANSFQDVTDAYVRLCAAKNQHEFCRFCLVKQTLQASCLIFARIFRGPISGQWFFNTIGLGCQGNMATQASVIGGCIASVNGFGHSKLERPQGRELLVQPQPVQIVAQPVVAQQVGGGARPPPQNSKGECCTVL
ncbi:unnamed protein product [Amoebophrya sp. A25]|nr:unnamed protein product [Amoebophrya sp. A25]|eukprot:GSA25T00023002001.1